MYFAPLRLNYLEDNVTLHECGIDSRPTRTCCMADVPDDCIHCMDGDEFRMALHS